MTTHSIKIQSTNAPNQTGTNQTLFNNAGQAYNHDVYWNSLAPNGGGEPKGKVAQLINRDFGSYEAFKVIPKRERKDEAYSGAVRPTTSPCLSIYTNRPSSQRTPTASLVSYCRSSSGGA